MKISVCMWRACKHKFAEYIIKRLEQDKQKFDLKDLEIEQICCIGSCGKWPNVIIDWKIEHNATPAKISKIVLDKIKK